MATFSLVCGYLNSSYYRVQDETGSYEIEFRRGLCDYERKIYNGDAQADLAPLVGCIKACCRPIPMATALAFNAWILGQHNDFVATLRNDPARYGEGAAESVAAPMLARTTAQWIGGMDGAFEFHNIA